MNSKVIVITGAKGGLGSFVTQRFLDIGEQVIGISRSIKDADFVSGAFTAVAGELSSAESTAGIISKAAQKYGRIDVLVHLLGGFAGGKNLEATDVATFEQMLDLNLRSAYFTFHAALPYLQNGPSGRIIAVGSRAATEPATGLSAYAASKAALASLIRTIAVENRDRSLTANLVLPGAMDTPANRAADPNGDYSKLINPARVAELIVWLASDAAAQVTGAAIPVYGCNA